jgi:hypothetical protein
MRPVQRIGITVRGRGHAGGALRRTPSPPAPLPQGEGLFLVGGWGCAPSAYLVTVPLQVGTHCNASAGRSVASSVAMNRLPRSTDRRHGYPATHGLPRTHLTEPRSPAPHGRTPRHTPRPLGEGPEVRAWRPMRGVSSIYPGNVVAGQRTTTRFPSSRRHPREAGPTGRGSLRVTSDVVAMFVGEGGRMLTAVHCPDPRCRCVGGDGRSLPADHVARSVPADAWLCVLTDRSPPHGPAPNA